jgi:hypothetical protein
VTRTAPDLLARRYRALLRSVRLQPSPRVQRWPHCYGTSCAAVACLAFTGPCTCMCNVCFPPWGG